MPWETSMSSTYLKQVYVVVLETGHKVKGCAESRYDIVEMMNRIREVIYMIGGYEHIKNRCKLSRIIIK